MELTSSIFVDQVGKSPDISDANTVAECGYEEIETTGPVSSYFIFILTPSYTASVYVVSIFRWIVRTETLKFNYQNI